MLSLGVPLVLSACVVPNPNAAGDAGETEGDESGLDVGDTDSGDADAGSDDGTAPAVPTVGVVEVDGATNPVPVERARILELSVAAQVAGDDVIAGVEFFDGDTSLGAGNPEGGAIWTLDWPITDDAFDGMHALTAEVLTEAEQSAISPATDLAIDLPQTGTLVWEWRENSLGEIRALVHDPTSEAVYGLGYEFVNGGAEVHQVRVRLDPATGTKSEWVTPDFGPATDDAELAEELVLVPGSGNFVAAGSLATVGGSSTNGVVVWFDGDGTELSRWESDFLDPTFQDKVTRLAYANDGQLYALLDVEEFDQTGRLLRFDAQGNYVAETSLSIEPSDLVVFGEQVWVVGRDDTGGSVLAKFGKDLAGLDSIDTVFGSTTLAVSRLDDQLYCAGNETSAVGRLGAYDGSGSESWSTPFGEGPSPTLPSIPLDVAVDPWNRALVLGTSGTGNFATVQRFTADGSAGEFVLLSGTTNAPDVEKIATDDIGYLYVSGHQSSAMGDYLFVAKFHP